MCLDTLTKHRLQIRLQSRIQALGGPHMERGILPAFVAMLGAVLVAMVMLGSSYAQVPRNPLNVPTPGAAQTRVVYSPGTDITANNLRYDEKRRTTYARGDVRIVIDSS